MVAEAHYTITEASNMTGYEPHVIRFYEKEFGLSIPRNKANHRYFTHKELEQLQVIKRLQEKGYTNTQIKLILANPDLISNSMDDIGDVAVTHTASISNNNIKYLDDHMAMLKNEIIEEIRNQFEFHQQPYRMALTGLAEEVKDLSDMIYHERNHTLKASDDVLLCENAKLRMLIKQKNYEIEELKAQIDQEKKKKKMVWSRLHWK